MFQFACIHAEMHCSVRLVLADSLICCVNLLRVIVIGRSHPANFPLSRMMVIEDSPPMLFS